MTDTTCDICGRSDGGHDPTPTERVLLRGVKWRAFWQGFFGFFNPALLPPNVPHILSASARAISRGHRRDAR